MKQCTLGVAVKGRKAMQGRPSGRYFTACTGCGINQHRDKRGREELSSRETEEEKRRRERKRQRAGIKG